MNNECLSTLSSGCALGHTKLMFRITDFSGHCLGGEGGIKIKIKLTERRLRSMQNQNNFIVTVGPSQNRILSHASASADTAKDDLTS